MESVDEAAHRGAGRGGARDTARALRLALGGGLLLLACVLAVALAARGAGGTGESVLEQAQARALTPEQQQVRVCARAGASCVQCCRGDARRERPGRTWRGRGRPR
jgi:hypothetical protein